MTALAVRILAFTHAGAVRPHNEDCLAVGGRIESAPMTEPIEIVHDLAQPVVLMVCDGMGGHNAGEVASDLAIRKLVRDLPGGAAESALAESLRRANQIVFDAAAIEPGRAGMGTTVAGIRIAAEGAFWFNVGDSRIYRYRNGFMRQLSIDDSGPTGGLTQALGGAGAFIDVEPHVGDEPVVAGWRYLICSDGLTDMVSFEEIEAALAEAPEIAVRRLFDAAMAAGGHDNISILLALVEGWVDTIEADVPGGDDV